MENKIADAEPIKPDPNRTLEPDRPVAPIAVVVPRVATVSVIALVPPTAATGETLFAWYVLQVDAVMPSEPVEESLFLSVKDLSIEEVGIAIGNVQCFANAY